MRVSFIIISVIHRSTSLQLYMQCTASANLWPVVLKFDPREALQLHELRDYSGCLFLKKRMLVSRDTIHRPVMLVKNHSDRNVDW